MTKHKTSHGELLFDYDWIKAQGVGSWCYEVTDEQVMVILAIANRMKWLARWYSPTGVLLDTDWIEKIVDNLQREFLSGGCMPNLEFQIGDGTGGLIDGDLYWRINGGTWINIGHVVGSDGAQGEPGSCACPGSVTDTGDPSDTKKCDKAELLSQRIFSYAGDIVGSQASNPTYTAEQLTDLIMTTYGEDVLTWAGCYNAVNYLITNLSQLSGLDTGMSNRQLGKCKIFCNDISRLGELSGTDIAAINAAIADMDFLNNDYERGYLALIFAAFSTTYIATQIFKNVVVNPYGSDCSGCLCEEYDWEQTFDFTSDDYDTLVKMYEAFAPTIPSSEYTASTGYTDVDISADTGYRRWCVIDIVLPESAVLTSLDMEFTASNGAGGDLNLVQMGTYAIYPYDSGYTGYVSRYAVYDVPYESQSHSPLWQGNSGSVVGVRLGIYVDFQADSGDLEGNATIARCTIRGLGDNPFS